MCVSVWGPKQKQPPFVVLFGAALCFSEANRGRQTEGGPKQKQKGPLVCRPLFLFGAALCFSEANRGRQTEGVPKQKQKGPLVCRPLFLFGATLTSTPSPLMIPSLLSPLLKGPRARELRQPLLPPLLFRGRRARHVQARRPPRRRLRRAAFVTVLGPLFLSPRLWVQAAVNACPAGSSILLIPGKHCLARLCD